ncbi:MAG: malto-oligosyltrehalose trehalohydrolase [Phycisphaerae bacterium]|nr:malto-oligosyltrehalose trehalohydrolase [Phycisphaerae bacterium]
MTQVHPLGAVPSPEGTCRFTVWAPQAEAVEVILGESGDRCHRLDAVDRGYHTGVAADVRPGARYRFRLDGEIERPDPASSSQPDGVHGSSAVIDPRFAWTDRQWKGLPLSHYVIYELHVGTFSASGTFAGVEKHLPALRELGVTAVELMPVAQFPGTRNWGYDGAYPFAVQNSYGGAEGLKHLVDAAHGLGMAVVLDVVYNHLGPEGNYLRDFGPYFTSRYHTPWGQALNFDGPESDEVRRFFIDNALRWVDEFHMDALRLDAVHAIVDNSAYPFLRELTDAVHARADHLGRVIHVIAETDANDNRVCRKPGRRDLGCDGQWCDDVHHALHARLTGERDGYYADFGSLDDVVVALRDGYVYQGQYSVFRRRRHGSSPEELSPGQFVVCIQNHDQVGNRMLGDRLTTLVSPEASKLAAGAVILSPFIPLLFMGEEYGETAPFQYFVSHKDPGLIEAVRKGRREEFASFSWKGETPDPQAEETFNRSRLNHDLSQSEPHCRIREYYRALLRLRSSSPVLSAAGVEWHQVEALAGTSVVRIKRQQNDADATALLFLNFAEKAAAVELPADRRPWRIALDSADRQWAGPGENRSGTAAGDRIDLYPYSMVVLLPQQSP